MSSGVPKVVHGSKLLQWVHSIEWLLLPSFSSPTSKLDLSRRPATSCPPSAFTAVEMTSTLRGGARVRLHGLRSRADLNGFHATVVDAEDAEEAADLARKSRVKVITDQEACSVLQANITPVPEDEDDGRMLYSNDTFAVIAEHGGYGIRAKRVIACGEPFWHEEPLAVQVFKDADLEAESRLQKANADLAAVVSMTSHGSSEIATIPGAQPLIDKALAIVTSITFPRLPAHTQRRFMGLSDCLSLWPWKVTLGDEQQSQWDLSQKSPPGVLQTNGFNKALPDGRSCTVVFEILSRMNHSCSASARIQINPAADAHDVVVTALKDIEPGEMLSINYGVDTRDERFQWTETRRSYLRDKYAFTCICSLCGPITKEYEQQQRDLKAGATKQHQAVLSRLS